LWRRIKLATNFIIASIVFNYFVTLLILLLNPHVVISYPDFFQLYLVLFIYYGPLWFLGIGLLFFVVQFFSEKKYPIGIFSPPTITYFLSFTVLVISFILYLNYVYYFSFFSNNLKSKFIQVLLIDLVLIITGILFTVIKNINKKWIQILFLLILFFNFMSSFNAIVVNNYDKLPGKRENPANQKITPRKMRIVIMDGLSLNFLFSLSAEQKLLNFDYLIKNGVRGHYTDLKFQT
jgi:Zn-dependent protease with chaperone function